MVLVTEGPGRPVDTRGAAPARGERRCERAARPCPRRARLGRALARCAVALCLAGGAAQAGGLSGPEGTQPPPGWQTAFDDGRLNPHRGRGDAAGSLATSRLWTDTVPRRTRPGADIAHGAEAGPPPGYAYAFDDGRLNPRRGLGTAF